jgi:hypothetical protein
VTCAKIPRKTSDLLQCFVTAGLKLKGTRQLLFYADDIIMLGGSIYTTKKKTEALLVACKKTVLEVNAEKTEYMVMSPDQRAGQNHNIKVGNK